MSGSRLTWLAVLMAMAAAGAVLLMQVRDRMWSGSPGVQPHYGEEEARAYYAAQLPAYTGPVTRTVADAVADTESAPPHPTLPPQAGGGLDGADAASAAGTGHLAEEPTDEEAERVVGKVKGAIQSCAAGVADPVELKMQVGAKGRVEWVAVRPSSKPLQTCVEQVVRQARFAATRKGGVVRATIEAP